MSKLDYPSVAIIGAGISGITVAIALAKLGIDNFTIYDRNPHCGGVWEENTYPGCACDVASHFYSSASELNPYWSRRYSPQPEIQEYWRRIHEKHRLTGHTSYLSELVRATWLEKSSRWKLIFLNVLTKEEFEVEVDILITAVGGFSKPLDQKPGSLPGLERFRGNVFHSARWDHSVDTAGKRVGVVGNGCSGAQLVPKVAADSSTTVINFVRSPQWYLPKADGPFAPWQKSVFAYIPGVMRLYRWRILLQGDLAIQIFRTKYHKLRDVATEASTKYIKETAPEGCLEFLIPKFPIGAKRIIYDPGYLESLNQPNVELIWDPIVRVTEDGVVLRSGQEKDLDILVLANGFDIASFLAAIDIRGRGGRILSEQWNAQGGPQAYLGNCISGFPNLFMLLGPNVATGHTSVIFFIECQVRWQMQVLKRLIRTGASSVEVKAEAEEQYNSWLQRALEDTVWATDKTMPWYRMPNGKIHALWPSSAIHFWWATLWPVWSDLEFVGAKRSATSVGALLGWTAVVATVGATAWYRYSTMVWR